MHEMFCIHVGQCGLQVGFAVWELLAAEHGIDRDGKSCSEDSDDMGSYKTFFNVSTSGHFVPRGIFVDLEPTVIDQMRKGSFSQLYHPDQLINGAEDAANNFARGFHTAGRIIKVTCENRIRKEFEVSDRIQGIHIYRSLGGGTGSGMTATLFEILLEYAKIARVEIPIHPSPHLSCAIVEPYNSILSEHFCMDDIDISFVIDNEALYDIITEKINVKEPTFHAINRLVAQVCSSVTASTRFENYLHNDFVFLTNLVPYPRIHFPLVSYAPFGSESKITRNNNSVSEITFSLFDASNQLVKCDPATGKYMSCSLVYRGNINPPEIYNTLSEIKSSRSVNFVDWCPTGFKVGVVNQPPQTLPNSHLGYSDKNVVMMTNSSSISSVWHRLAQKFHRLYAKRSFVHWFVAEGLEESEFCESLYNLATLAKDYEEVVMDTKFDESKAESPAGEGGLPPGEGTPIAEGGEGGKAVKKETESKKEEIDGDDENEDGNDNDNDDEDNASNNSKLHNCSKNNKVSSNWHNKFETLFNSICEIRETVEHLKNSISPEKEENSKILRDYKKIFSRESTRQTENVMVSSEKYSVNSNRNNTMLIESQLCAKHVTDSEKKIMCNKNFKVSQEPLDSDGCTISSDFNTDTLISHSNLTDIEVSNITASAFDFNIETEEVTTSFLIEELIRITSSK